MGSKYVKKRYHENQKNDELCSVCQEGGYLLLCDRCPSSYHLECAQIETIPDGKWFCPSCCCGLCGLRDPNDQTQLITEVCYQCSRQYHVDCMGRAGIQFPRNIPSENFCSQSCFKLHDDIQNLLGISFPTGVDGLTWKLLKSNNSDFNMNDALRADTHVKLSQALDLLRACFKPIIIERGKRNMIIDIINNSTSKYKRLDFHGFFVMVLQKDDELTCVATVRIHGQKLAEMPLVATMFKYRGQGMCRVLLHELTKMLSKWQVQRLVLPSVSEQTEFWQSVFGFSKMSTGEKLEILGFPLLVFRGTIIYQKILSKTMFGMEIEEVSQEPSRFDPKDYLKDRLGPGTKRKFRNLNYKLRSEVEVIRKEKKIMLEDRENI